MSPIKWANLYTAIWVGVFVLLVLFVLSAFLLPGSPRKGYVFPATAFDISAMLAIVYFPYISVSVFGLKAFQKSQAQLSEARASQAKWLLWLIIGFNAIVIMVTVAFVVDDESNAEVMLTSLPKLAALFSLLLTGFFASFYTPTADHRNRAGSSPRTGKKSATGGENRDSEEER